MLDEEIGYISVVEFDRVTADQFKSKIEELQGEGMKRLIIDLRNNPGGEVTTVVSMADYILKDGGRILTVANKKGTEETYDAEDGHRPGDPDGCAGKWQFRQRVGVYLPVR